MFDSLTKRLSSTLDRLRGRGRLTEAEVAAAAREIRIALLEADVALPVVRDFVERVKRDAVGQDIVKGVTAGQQVVKIVNDALVDMLGGGQEAEPLAFGSAPCAYLMVGLQGSGKTTTTAKLAVYLRDKHGKRALAASLDTYRPAAREQLQQLGAQAGFATLPIVVGEGPLDIAARALREGRTGGYDVVLLDTAGRTSVDAAMMAEAAAIAKATGPVETLLVADAMTGQDAVNTARAFAEEVGLTGIVLTRADGDARGGAALSMRAVTGRPVKLLGVGERWDALEPFHAGRVAGRILGMGDVVSLVEKAAEVADADAAEKMLAAFQAGRFTFHDLLAQMRQMKKMGGLGYLMGMLPGVSGLAEKAAAAGLDDGTMKRQEAIILSMTQAERGQPELLNMSRKRRIAAGSGTSVAEVNKLTKQLDKVQGVMKHLKRGGLSGLMGQMLGGDGPPPDMEALLAQAAPQPRPAPTKKKRKPRPKRVKRR
ncbi:MAG: signal recognition particle protein [Alphaproteobacteria bacterium]|jgi:signal recognition particle subunit SRP54|nr:signal recognition particle protein [Alphaproteobacteria bacterium]